MNTAEKQTDKTTIFRQFFTRFRRFTGVKGRRVTVRGRQRFFFNVEIFFRPPRFVPQKNECTAAMKTKSEI